MAVIQVQYDPNVDPNQKPSGGEFAPTPKGRHHLQLSDAVHQPAKPGKDHAQLQMQYTVVQSADQSAIGKSRKMWLSFSPKSTPYFLIPMLQAAGVNFELVKVPTAQGMVDAVSFDTDELEGAVVEATCKHHVVAGNDGNIKTYEDWGDFAVSNLNPRLAAPQAAAPQAAAPAAQPVAQGFRPQPAAQAAQGMPQPQQGQVPPRRFG
jgi:hypothetical protein